MTDEVKELVARLRDDADFVDDCKYIEEAAEGGINPDIWRKAATTLERVVRERDEAQRDRFKYEEELRRHNFYRCNAPACNCGGWHRDHDALDARIAELEAVLRELTDLMDAIVEGEYTPDSFTTQPARRTLSGEKT